MSYTVNSEAYYNNIRNKLSYFVKLVETDNRVNLQALNIHAEGILMEFLRCLFGWQLKNANTKQQNAPGIDLLDENNKIIVQVSSTNTHEKIQESLKKSDKPEYSGHHFYFVALTEEEKRYRSFTVPEGLAFDKNQDVLSIPVLLRHVQSAGIETKEALSELMDKHFGSEKRTPKGQCLTRMPERTTTKQVICRDKELEDIKDKLQSGENILLMSGFGGIGKTALARLVFHEVKTAYDEVAWISYNHCLKDSMLAAIQLFEDINDPEARWNAILNLKNNGKSKLFVIDNADRDEKTGQSPQDDRDLNALSGWPNTTVIVTSRKASLQPFTIYPVGIMDEDKCVELFYRYYESQRRAEDEKVVRQLIQLAGCHTFTVELLAKGANCEDSLEEYHQDLKEEGFAFPDIEVDAAHNDATTTIAGHLKILFNRKTRTDIQMKLLYDLSVLPTVATLSKKEIKEWFGIDVNTCEQLVKDGWLFRENGRYSMHPLVKEILHLDQIPEGTVKEFLDFIEDYQNGYFPDGEVYTETLRKLELAESVVTAVCHKETVQLADILHNMGGAYWRVGQFQKAKERLVHAIRIKEAKLGEDHPSTATTYNGIAVVYRDMGDLPKALEFHEKAKAIHEAMLGKDHPDTATTYNNIASVYQDMGDFPKALKFYEKALPIYKSKLGEDHPNTATTYNNIAGVYQAMGDLPKALEFFEKALPILETKLGKVHPNTAATYNNIALVYDAMGDLPKALEFYKKDVAISEVKLGKDHPDTATTYNNIATVYQAMGNLPKALKFFEKVLPIVKATLGKDHPHTAATYNNIAIVYKAMGDLPKTLEFFEKSLTIKEAKLGGDHPSTAITYNNIGTLYYEQKDYPAAKAYLLKALRILLIKLGAGHPHTQNTLLGLSLCHEAEHGSEEGFIPWLMEQLNENERQLLSAWAESPE